MTREEKYRTSNMSSLTNSLEMVAVKQSDSIPQVDDATSSLRLNEKPLIESEYFTSVTHK